MNLILLLAVLTLGDTLTFEKSLELKGCEEYKIEISLGAAKVNVLPGGDSELEVSARYPEGILDYFKAAPTDENPCEIAVEGKLRKGIKLENWEKLAGKSIEAEIKLPKDVPMNLEVNHGLARATLDLGGLKLRGLNCSFGAGKTVIDFSSPNRDELRDFEIDHGLASLKLLHVGNARFKKLTLEHGLSRLYLDLSGKWKNDAEIDISCAFASIDIVAPEDLGVFLKMEGILSSRDLEGVKKTDEGYKTLNYDEAEHKVIIEIEGALNLVDFRIEGRN